MRLHLTEDEAKFLETRLRLTVMNERGQESLHAERILDALTDSRRLRSATDHITEMFADLYPAGGRE
jgi:hypothetical protein